jgi:hypothetical protein
VSSSNEIKRKLGKFASLLRHRLLPLPDTCQPARNAIMTSHHPIYDSQLHPYAQQQHPPFKPLPFDETGPSTPPQAYNSSSDPFDSPYSSHNQMQHFTGAKTKESTFETSAHDSYPPQAPPPPLVKPRSSWSNFWATYNTKNQVSMFRCSVEGDFRAHILSQFSYPSWLSLVCKQQRYSL